MEMTAVPLLIPKASIPDAHDVPLARGAAVRSLDFPQRRLASQTAPASRIAHPHAPHAEWRLTDRGLTVIMVVAALILAAAVVVIGMTVVRVASGEYDASGPVSQQAQG
jgi:hypothetical protein